MRALGWLLVAVGFLVASLWAIGPHQRITLLVVAFIALTAGNVCLVFG